MQGSPRPRNRSRWAFLMASRFGNGCVTLPMHLKWLNRPFLTIPGVVFFCEVENTWPMSLDVNGGFYKVQISDDGRSWSAETRPVHSTNSQGRLPRCPAGWPVVEIGGIYGPKYAIGLLKTFQYQQERLWNCQKRSKYAIEPRNVLDHCGWRLTARPLAAGSERSRKGSSSNRTTNWVINWHFGVKSSLLGSHHTWILETIRVPFDTHLPENPPPNHSADWSYRYDLLTRTMIDLPVFTPTRSVSSKLI